MSETSTPAVGCRCDEDAEEHACPFAAEINYDETPCACCESCTDECAMGI